MKRRPRKIAFKLLLFLLAGAIINVAVAWGCAYRHDPHNVVDSMTDIPEDEAKLLWEQQTPPDWPRETIGGARFPGLGAFQDVLSPDDDGGPWALVILYAGLPAKTFRGEMHMDGQYAVRYSGLWQMSERITLPLRPIFAGFAINTIFYAAIVWAMFAVPGAIRRRVRRKRGQCAACGYSLRENASDKCPECGQTKRSHKGVIV